MRENFLQVLERQPSINGRYNNVRRIGHEGGDGAFSILLSADDAVTGRRIALKFFDPRSTHDSYRMACFERESQVLKRLSGQEHILQIVDEVRVFDFTMTERDTGIEFQIPVRFIATELAESSVHDALYTGKLKSPLRLLGIFRSICKGVRRIHGNQICHRDIKPSNCLLVDRKNIRVSDFGTARSLDGTIASPQVLYRAPVGDTRYSAPELLCGLDGPSRFQCEADMYSLGAILYELFTQAPLGLHLQSVINSLLGNFSVIPDRDKQKVFDNIVATVANQNPLPDILNSAPPEGVPRCILHPLDSLYKGLACLDYRKRLTSWDSIFNQLNIMTIRLRKEMEQQRKATYRRFQRERRKFANQIAPAQG